MIEKMKYHLLKAFSAKQMRVCCLAVMTAITLAVVTLLSYSIYTINIFDGEKTYTVRALSNNVTTALSGVTLKSNSYNIENTSVTGRTTSVKIAYTFPVYITCNNKTVELEVTGGTVGELLKSAGFTVDEHDYVQPSVDTKVDSTVYIDYTDISYSNGSYTEAIPYKTENVYSSTTEKGVTTTQPGKEGLREVEFTEKFVNGVSQGKSVTASTVITEPVNGKKIIGTKEIVKAVKTSADVKAVSQLSPSSAIELDANGNPVNYKSKMTVRATAYTYTGNKCATGVAPKPGYIAVNPNVIPYGTKLYIKSPNGNYIYGYAVAADTGGFVNRHPTGIDLFLTSHSACTSFGVRNMEVYILN